MFPAQPPHSRRISAIWNDTDSTCVCSGRMWRAKRSGNTMMVSYASEPQINVRLDMRGILRSGGFAPALIFASDLADDRLLAARHRQSLRDALEQHLPAVSYTHLRAH